VKPIQNHDAATGLVSQFGLRGRSIFSLDEIIVPTRDIGDFAGRSPFEPRVVGGDFVNVAAVVARYSGLAIIPAPGTLLAVESLYLLGVGGASRANVQVMRPADIAATNVISANQAVGQWNGLTRSTGFAPQASHVWTSFDAASASPGGSWGQFVTPTNDTREWPGLAARPVVLDGDDPAGPLALAVIVTTANVRLDVGWQATEYRQAP
jgi:hypothetical protein